MISINYWAVLVAAIANFVLGGLWYGPLFGKQWMALSGAKMDKVGAEKNRAMVRGYVLMFVGSLVMAWILSYAVVAVGPYLATMGVLGISAGLLIGAMNWLGFIAPVSLGSVLWEGKPWALWFLNAGYYLVSLGIMGAILYVWH